MGCNSKQNDGGMLLHRVSDLCRQDCFHVSRSKDLMDLCKVQLVHILFSNFKSNWHYSPFLAAKAAPISRNVR